MKTFLISFMLYCCLYIAAFFSANPVLATDTLKLQRYADAVFRHEQSSPYLSNTDVSNSTFPNIAINLYENYHITDENYLRAPQASGSTYDYHSILSNGNFELGHSYWWEWWLYNGSWVDADLIITDSGYGYDTWSAYLTWDDWLESYAFTIPDNSKALLFDYKYQFWYTGTCTYGTNGVGFYLHDYTAGEDFVVGIHDTNLDEPMYSWGDASISFDANDYGKDFRNMENHDLRISYLHINDDPNCTLTLDLDNISVTAARLIPENHPTGTPNKYLYRFWSSTKKSHFFTANYVEAYNLATFVTTNDADTWRYEGVANNVYTTQQPDSIPVYRFWSPVFQGHFYTSSENEKNNTINDPNWNYEGPAYYIYPLSYSGSATTVYRFWSPDNRHHFYTASSSERDNIIATYPTNVWTYEGPVWKVPL